MTNNNTKYKYHPLYVKQKDWNKYRKEVKSFVNVIELFSLKKG